MNPKVDDALLLEALRNVARDGNVADPSDHSPAASLMRIRLEDEGLAVWDPYAGRVVPTPSGRRRLVEAGRGTGIVLAFPAPGPARR